jgi:hypothetical protein
VAVRAAGWWYDDPAPLGGHEVADEVVRELVPRLGHGDVVPRTIDNNLGSGLLAPLQLFRRSIERWAIGPRGNERNLVMGTPAQPTGLTPGSTSQPGTLVTTSFPTLTWKATPGANAYSIIVLQVGGGAIFTQSPGEYQNQNQQGDSVTLELGNCILQDGETYAWSVTASDGTEESSPSLLVYFTVTLPPPTPMVLLANGLAGPIATLADDAPIILSWTPLPGATSYSGTVNEPFKFEDIWQFQTSETSVTAPPKFGVPGGLIGFSYGVQASNAAGTDPTVHSNLFELGTPKTVPAAPTGLTPGGAQQPGTAVPTQTPTLAWTASPDATVLAYVVTIAQADDPTNAVSFATISNSIPCPIPLPLPDGFTYVWSVSAANNAFASAKSEAFFTITLVPPPPTDLSAGGHDPVQSLTPTLTWVGSPEASEYSVTVTQVGGEAVLSRNVTTTSIVCPTLVNGATYQWSVSASNQAGSSTAVSSFFTIDLPTAPTAPTGLTPGAPTQPGQKVTSATPTLTWAATPAATGYSVLVERVDGVTLLNQNVATNSIVCPALTSGATYQWLVVASNSAGRSAPSAIAYITYQPG